MYITGGKELGESRPLFSTITRGRFYSGIAFLLVISMLDTSVITTTSKTARAEPSQSHYSGKILFEGFYFARGPVPKKFPEYSKGITQPTEKATSVQNRWMQNIQKNDPSYFSKFRQDMYSGNRIRIQNALEQGSWKLADAIANGTNMTASQVRNGSTESNTKASNSPQAVYRTTNLYLYSQVAGAKYVAGYNVAIGATFAIGVLAVLYFAAPAHTQPLSGKDQLIRDRFVNDVATKLAT